MSHWTTPEGRVLYRAELSDHHIWFPRREFHTPTEKKLRAMGGMIVRLANQPHRDLHANVGPPPKPSPDLMRDIYLHGRTREYVDQYDLFRQVANYVGLIAEVGTGQRQEEAAILHENIVQQAGFIELGRVEFIKDVA